MNEVGSSEYRTTAEDRKYRHPLFISFVIYSSVEISLDLNFRMIGVELLKMHKLNPGFLIFSLQNFIYHLWTPHYS